MRDALIGGVVALALLFTASQVSAQTIEGFLTRVGLRASVQAYQVETWPGQKRTVQPSVNVGVIWRH